jgi:hypothetical protein
MFFGKKIIVQIKKIVHTLLYYYPLPKIQKIKQILIIDKRFIDKIFACWG